MVNFNIDGDLILRSINVEVSIPQRDFGEFQLETGWGFTSNQAVSIPQRDFGEFQLAVKTPVPTLTDSFQSLKGILVNFNGDRLRTGNLQGCFNPSKGFW
ncbi:Epoxyqueuosine (oQ) reductase QueG [Geitlerinema sp. FC II]|nr:Epoxyqueuosine (oQ) reductase QueG [Geitlerinema sp. FC II]